MGMSEEKIEVIAHSGYRAEESPRTILLHDERIEVIEVMKQWIQERSDDRSQKRFYQVKGSDRTIHMIYYDEKVMEWFHLK
jgi:hypothetical protein